MHAGPRQLAAIGVLAQPPILADALPEPGQAFAAFVRPFIALRLGWVVVHELTEQAPFLLRDRHRLNATELLVGHSRERRRVPGLSDEYPTIWRGVRSLDGRRLFPGAGRCDEGQNQKRVDRGACAKLHRTPIR